MGQFNDALDKLPLHDNRAGEWHDDMRDIAAILQKHTKQNIDLWNSYFSISSKEVNPAAQIAWDLQQVLRHRMSWDHAVREGIVPSIDSPRDWSKMMGVNYDKPFMASSEPLATITKGD